MTIRETESDSLTESEKWQVELDKHPTKICPGGDRIGLRHLWWAKEAPIICKWRSGKVVIVGRGTTCGWSGWSDAKNRYLDCYFGPVWIKSLVDFKVQGLTPEIARQEALKGPSLRDHWGWNFNETEHGWRNVNDQNPNDSPLGWHNVKKSYAYKSIPTQKDVKVAASEPPEQPEFPGDDGSDEFAWETR